MTKRIQKIILIFSLILTITALVLSINQTTAWFSSKLVSSENTIKSGSLKIDLKYSYDGKSYNFLDSSNSAIFTKDSKGSDLIWQPSDYHYRYLKVSNIGSLDFKYQITVSRDGESKDNLDEKIEVYLIEKSEENDILNLGSFDEERYKSYYLSNLKSLLDSSDNLLPEKSHLLSSNCREYVLLLYMDKNAGNKYQSKSVQPFNINFEAHQTNFQPSTLTP